MKCFYHRVQKVVIEWNAYNHRHQKAVLEWNAYNHRHQKAVIEWNVYNHRFQKAVIKWNVTIIDFKSKQLIQPFTWNFYLLLKMADDKS